MANVSHVGSAELIRSRCPHICADAAVPVLIEHAEGGAEHAQLLLGDAGQDGATLLLRHGVDPAPAKIE